MSVNIAIIGSGPASASAALYLGMAGFQNITIFSGNEPGGQLTTTNIVENYLGFESISGQELSDKFLNHSKKHGNMVYEYVVNVFQEENTFKVITKENNYCFDYVIICSGSSPRKLIPLKDYENKGVSYCHICDGFLYKNKNVVVVGGGNSAFEAALYLSSICNKVTLIHRNDSFKAFDSIVKKVEGNAKIEIKTFVEIERVDEKNNQLCLFLSSGKKIEVDGVFVNIGHTPNTSFINLKKDSQGYIIANRKNETSIKGVYAAGDCCVYDDGHSKYLQAVIAASEGCSAALSLVDFINNK